MANPISNLLARLRALGDKVNDLGIMPALARLTVGIVFLQSGWGKLHNLDGTTEFFASLNIPMPGFNAVLTSCTEFFGGILILLGLGTRLVALPMAFTMVIAIITAKRGDIKDFGSLFGFDEWAYLVFFLWLAAAGAGKLSLDALLARVRAGRSAHAELPKPAFRPGT